MLCLGFCIPTLTSVQKQYYKLRKSTIIAQTLWRGILARRQLRELRIEARKLSTVVAQKSALERKLEELNWKYEAEVLTRQKLEKEKEKQEQLIAANRKFLEQENILLTEEIEKLKKALEDEKKLRREFQNMNTELKETLQKVEEMRKQEGEKFQRLVHDLDLFKQERIRAKEVAEKAEEILYEKEKLLEKITNEKAQIQTEKEKLSERNSVLVKQNEELLKKLKETEEQIENMKTLAATALEKEPQINSENTPLSVVQNGTIRSAAKIAPPKKKPEEFLRERVSHIFEGSSSTADQVIVDLLISRNLKCFKQSQVCQNLAIVSLTAAPYSLPFWPSFTCFCDAQSVLP